MKIKTFILPIIGICFFVGIWQQLLVAMEKNEAGVVAHNKKAVPTSRLTGLLINIALNNFIKNYQKIGYKDKEINNLKEAIQNIKNWHEKQICEKNDDSFEMILLIELAVAQCNKTQVAVIKSLLSVEDFWNFIEVEKTLKNKEEKNDDCAWIYQYFFGKKKIIKLFK